MHVSQGLHELTTNALTYLLNLMVAEKSLLKQIFIFMN